MRPICGALAWLIAITRARPGSWQWRFAYAVVGTLAYARGRIDVEL